MSDSRYFDLGKYHRPITTGANQVQLWFDRGLNWCYGFNHEEAARCFTKAIELDDQCAMAYWGLAYASGPFYNKPWAWYGDRERIDTIKNCFQFAEQAKRLKHRVSEVEAGLIEAICTKHPKDYGNSESELNGWLENYAQTMRDLLRKFPDDLDVICLSAEALMNLTPWKLWDLQKAIPDPLACTEEAIQILQHGLELVERNNLIPHPGIIHFHIHVFEMSPTPEVALPQADRLRDLCPECGHLLHMASHIDSLCGQWSQAVIANSRAIEADLNYIELRGKSEFYMISALHNFHFKMYAAMFLGQYEAAMSAANQICALVIDDMLEIEEAYLATTLESYYASRVHVLVRFGHWQQITELPLPGNSALYLITTTMLHYAKTIAYAALGNIEVAKQHKKMFEAFKNKVPDWHLVANNPTLDILAVAEAMMNGEFEYHAGNHELGYELLRKATDLSDNLAYSEPWPWMHPPRHALAALLLEQNQVEEALKHYSDDLGFNQTLPRCVQHPGNIWSLHGYHECLVRLGQHEQAAVIKPDLETAMALSDTPITSSCCCRKHTLGL